ncbi:hypothetical protein AAF712_003200 [Marasmius tenuissimus]|uniref:Uncharacterized protein n=1 Tax=Marasmius tenuissimus TaxID=585030 RepID=A0ABR3A6E2_9AGAR
MAISVPDSPVSVLTSHLSPPDLTHSSFLISCVEALVSKKLPAARRVSAAAQHVINRGKVILENGAAVKAKDDAKKKVAPKAKRHWVPSLTKAHETILRNHFFTDLYEFVWNKEPARGIKYLANIVAQEDSMFFPETTGNLTVDRRLQHTRWEDVRKALFRLGRTELGYTGYWGEMLMLDQFACPFTRAQYDAVPSTRTEKDEPQHAGVRWMENANALWHVIHECCSNEQEDNVWGASNRPFRLKKHVRPIPRVPEKLEIHELLEFTAAQQHELDDYLWPYVAARDNPHQDPNDVLYWHYMDIFVDSWLRRYLPGDWTAWSANQLRYARQRVIRLIIRHYDHQTQSQAGIVKLWRSVFPQTPTSSPVSSRPPSPISTIPALPKEPEGRRPFKPLPLHTHCANDGGITDEELADTLRTYTVNNVGNGYEDLAETLRNMTI